MCKVHNSIGSLKAIRTHLHENDIHDFNSVRELIDFQRNFRSIRDQVVTKHRGLIEREREELIIQISDLKESIALRTGKVKDTFQQTRERLRIELANTTWDDGNTIGSLVNYFKKIIIRFRIAKTENNLKAKVASATYNLSSTLVNKTRRYETLVSQFERAVYEDGYSELQLLERKKRVIDEVNTLIYGAIGEQKVVNELERLSDDYILINDFSLRFQPAIFNARENDYIKSIQIDHLLISPAGIFIIETKNWSQHSLSNLNLRSPVQQIQRTSFALFKMLHGDTRKVRFGLNQHHWGAKKVPMKSLIVLINEKPNEEFQYVKILQLKELIGYISYFKPVFSKGETEAIADGLLSCMDSLMVFPR